ncbi:MAG: RNA methyltransferase [Syntrophobacteria bacterium]
MDVHVALLHYPVYNRQRQVIVSAVTNLDIHDIARAARTYGVSRFFVVTPLDDQRKLVERLLSHWLAGYGAHCHPERKMALELVTLASSLTEVGAAIAKSSGQSPELLATGASVDSATLSYWQARERIRQPGSMLILFGTGWGLSDEILDLANHRLAPISGVDGYNHLSVRSAAGIILDRLLGKRDE